MTVSVIGFALSAFLALFARFCGTVVTGTIVTNGFVCSRTDHRSQIVICLLRVPYRHSFQLLRRGQPTFFLRRPVVVPELGCIGSLISGPHPRIFAQLAPGALVKGE
jgi:hypothetical protein